MRTYRRLEVRLKKADRDQLDGLLSGGVQPVRTVLRALALQQLSGGKSAAEVACLVPLTSKAVREIGRRYEQSGLEQALYDKDRPGASTLLEPAERKRIIAMVCSDPPEGRSRWTVRLVAEEAVKRRLVPKVGRETIRLLLLHDDLKPWREKNVERAGTDRAVRRADGGRTGGRRPMQARRPISSSTIVAVTRQCRRAMKNIGSAGMQAQHRTLRTHSVVHGLTTDEVFADHNGRGPKHGVT